MIHDHAENHGGDGALQHRKEAAFRRQAVARRPDDEAHDGAGDNGRIKSVIESQTLRPVLVLYAETVACDIGFVRLVFQGAHKMLMADQPERNDRGEEWKLTTNHRAQIVEREVRDRQSRQCFMHATSRHFEPIGQRTTASSLSVHGELSGTWTTLFPLEGTAASTDLDIALEDEHVAAAVVACLLRVKPTLTAGAQVKAQSFIELLQSSVEFVVGRNFAQGTCFFASLGCIFPGWTVSRQKSSLFEAVEASPPAMAAVVRELSVPFGVPSFNRRLEAGEELKKEFSGVELSDPLVKKSTSSSDKKSSSKKKSSTLSESKEKSKSAAKKKHVSNDVSNNRFAPIVVEDGDISDDDSEFLPSDDELHAGDDDSTSRPRSAQRRSRRLAAKGPSSNRSSPHRAQHPSDFHESDPDPSKGGASVVWGLKKSCSKSALIALASSHGIKAPKPQLVKLISERSPKHFHHLVLHHTLDLAAKWREVFAAVPGVRVRQWLSLEDRTVTQVSPLRTTSQPASHHRASASATPSRQSPEDAPAPAWLASLMESLAHTIKRSLQSNPSSQVRDSPSDHSRVDEGHRTRSCSPVDTHSPSHGHGHGNGNGNRRHRSSPHSSCPHNQCHWERSCCP